jgi:hypothetical protein
LPQGFPEQGIRAQDVEQARDGEQKRLHTQEFNTNLPQSHTISFVVGWESAATALDFPVSRQPCPLTDYVASATVVQSSCVNRNAMLAN